MAKKTMEQHKRDVERWGPQGLRMVQFAMEKVGKEVLVYAQKNRLNAPAPRGPHSRILGEVSGNLIRSLAEESAVQSSVKGSEVVIKVGTNLTNKGYSYPRKHEYGLGVRERAWLRPSIKAKQSRLRTEIKKAWVMAYGK